MQYGVASGALAWGIGFGWTPIAYRIFYLFGAVLNVAWLGLGTVWLFTGPPVGRGAFALLFGLSWYAAMVVLLRSFVPGASDALTTSGIPVAGDVMPGDVRALSRWFSIGGSVALLGGLAWSLWRTGRLVGLSLLAAGVVAVAVGSELARTGRVVPFSIGLALGIALMYAGFLRAGGDRIGRRRSGGSVGAW
jgi:hypothetical protein